MEIIVRITSRLLLTLAAGIFLISSVLQGQEAHQREVESAILAKAAQNIEKYRKGDVAIIFKKESGEAVRDAELEITQTGHEFLFGCIIFDLIRNGETYRPELYKERFRKLFNFAVFPFYWAGYEPVQGMPGWEKLLPVLEWCKANGIATKGHPLVWTAPSGKPDWLVSYPLEVTEDLLRARVINTVGGFKDWINIWDVFNEAVNTRTWESDSDGVWREEPLEKVAPLVEKAFKWAYSANPQATLILNEYYTIAKKTTRERFYELVKELKKRDTPVSGLGIQAHEPRQHWFPPQDVWDDYDRLGELGLPLHITEFIPQSGGQEITGGWRKGTWNLETQAEFAEQFFRLSFGHPAVVSINWWGMSDRDIWLPGGGLVTDEYRPKPVYNRLDSLINVEWKTRLSARTDSNGSVKFRGFFGRYAVKIKTRDGKTQSYELPVRRDEENRWVFYLKR